MICFIKSFIRKSRHYKSQNCYQCRLFMYDTSTSSLELVEILQKPCSQFSGLSESTSTQSLFCWLGESVCMILLSRRLDNKEVILISFCRSVKMSGSFSHKSSLICFLFALPNLFMNSTIKSLYHDFWHILQATLFDGKCCLILRLSHHLGLVFHITLHTFLPVSSPFLL